MKPQDKAWATRRANVEKQRSMAAKKANETRGAEGRRQAAIKASRTRKMNAKAMAIAKDIDENLLVNQLERQNQHITKPQRQLFVRLDALEKRVSALEKWK